MFGFVAVKTTVADEAIVAPTDVVPDAAPPTVHLIGPVPSLATVHPFEANVFPKLNPPSVAGLTNVVWENKLPEKQKSDRIRNMQ